MLCIPKVALHARPSISDSVCNTEQLGMACESTSKVWHSIDERRWAITYLVTCDFREPGWGISQILPTRWMNPRQASLSEKMTESSITWTTAGANTKLLYACMPVCVECHTKRFSDRSSSFDGVLASCLVEVLGVTHRFTIPSGIPWSHPTPWPNRVRAMHTLTHTAYWQKGIHRNLSIADTIRTANCPD